MPRQRTLATSRPVSTAGLGVFHLDNRPTPQAVTGPVGQQTGLDYEVVSGNDALAGSAAFYKQGGQASPRDERNEIAKQWQIEAYRHTKICGEARYSVTLSGAIAGRAEIGVSEPNTLRAVPQWVNEGPEVDAFAEIVPTVRDRTRLIRDFMLHRAIAGEAYLVGRKRRDTDSGYIAPPLDSNGNPQTWDEYRTSVISEIDMFSDAEERPDPDPNLPLWEIVAVTEIQKTGDGTWKVRHDNDNWLDLAEDEPVIRMWNPDPERRREAWSPMQALLPTLREIEWLTMHIFTQIRSRLMSAGVWFLPKNLTHSTPPPNGRFTAEQIAAMNEAEQFMLSLAGSALNMLDPDEVAFPSVVMAEPDALEKIEQSKLIQFWSEIDEKAMELRSDAIRRFALGMDLPPEQVLGSSGVAVSNSGGSAGSVNHWGEWAKEEQTIQNHIEPGLDDLVTVLTEVLRKAVDGTKLVIAYGTASLRLRQDRSKQSIELVNLGLIKGEVAVRENGFDPDHDMMTPAEYKIWLLTKIVSGSYAPDQMAVAMKLLAGIDLPEGDSTPRGVAGPNQDRNLDQHPVQGPPQGDHDHNDAAYGAAEVLVLRALEKYGNQVLNAGKRGRDRDYDTPPLDVPLTASLGRTVIWSEFDFSLLAHVKAGYTPEVLGRYCASLYNKGEGYSRETLIKTLEAA